MPRRRSDEVIIDPVAAAEQLGQQAAPEPLASMTGPDAETERGRRLPAGGMYVDLAQIPTTLMEPSVEAGQSPGGRQCALGHQNVPGARFCASCGLTMDAPAPAARADLDAARPKPASQLSAEERAERDRQHAEALAAARQFEAQQPSYVPPEGATVLIHFIEDGLTFAGQVWYRGQEIEIGPAHPRWEQARGWILLDKYAQIERYGKQYFDRGPWPGRRSYTEGADSYQRLYAGRDGDGKLANPFAGPGEEALRQADEVERRRGRAVPGMVIR